MEVKLYLIFSIFLGLYATGTVCDSTGAAYLNAFVQCADNFKTMNRDNACGKLESIISCAKNLLVNSDVSPSVCDEKDTNSYCSIMGGSLSAPMGRQPEIRHPLDTELICRVYNKMKTCNDKECKPGGNRFKPPPNYPPDLVARDSRGDPCPKKAFENCVQPVSDLDSVTEESCVQVAKAKTCYLDALESCSGTDLQNYFADIIIAGLGRHIYMCKKKDYSFAGDSGCVANPIDVYTPEEFGFRREDGKPTISMETCDKVHHYARELEKFSTKCETKLTDYSKYNVKNLMGPVNNVRLECFKSGFKDSNHDEDGGNTAFKNNPNGLITLLALIFIPVLMYCFVNRHQ